MSDELRRYNLHDDDAVNYFGVILVFQEAYYFERTVDNYFMYYSTSAQLF
jgi:hypothetical protein